MKKLLAIVLVLLTLVSLSMPILAADAQQTVVIGGKTYYTVSTVEQFEKMSGKRNYILKKDIDFGGKVYDSNVVAALCQGIINGDGHKIYNFSIDTSSDAIGIFNLCYITDSEGNYINAEGLPTDTPQDVNYTTLTLMNLQIGTEDAPITVKSTGANFIGVVSGKTAVEYEYSFTDITVYANVSSDTGNGIAGFIGLVNNDRDKTVSTLTNCKFYGSVTTGGEVASGFVGYCYSCMKFENCENNAAITAKRYVGGFVGVTAQQVYGAPSFIDCVNNGDISGCAPIAGIIATPKAGSMYKRCTNNGDIYGKASSYHGVGGIVGQANNASAKMTSISQRLEACVNNGTIYADSQDGSYGGLVGHATEHLSIADCTNNGDIVVRTEEPTGSFYIGGIVGKSALQKTSDTHKKNEKYIVEINNTKNTGDITYKSAQQGAAGGIIGGFVFTYGDHGTLRIGRCTNTGNIVDTSIAAVNNMLGGMIGYFGPDSAVLRVTNSMNTGAITGTANDSVGGMLGYTSSYTNASDEKDSQLPAGELPVIRHFENCLNTGALTKGDSAEGVAAIACNKVAGGTLVNCYTLSALSDTETNEYELALNEDTAKLVTVAQLENGEAAFLLGSAFGQDLATEKLPVVGGNAVMKNSDGHMYNAQHTHDFTGNDYEKNDTGTHVRLCNICKEKIAEPHVFDKAKDKGDGTHTKHCKLCGYESVPQKHKCNEFEDNGDGTHSGTCSECGAGVSEEHTFEEGNCTVCGFEEPVVTEEPETEETVAETEPEEEKGCGSSLAIGGVAVACMAAVAVTFDRKKVRKKQ